MSTYSGKGSSNEYDRPMRKDDFPDDSWRLTFLNDNGYIKLTGARRLKMIAPPSDKLGKLDPCTGFCCELRTVRGRVLYRRFGSNPIKNNIEVYGVSSANKFTNVTIENSNAEFDILVPIVKKASKIVLLGDASGKIGGLMKPLIEFDLNNLPTQNNY